MAKTILGGNLDIDVLLIVDSLIVLRKYVNQKAVQTKFRFYCVTVLLNSTEKMVTVNGDAVVFTTASASGEPFISTIYFVVTWESVVIAQLFYTKYGTN